MKKLSVIFAVALCAIALGTGAVWAEDEYTYMYTAEVLKTLELENGVMANEFVQRGFAFYKDASNPFHMANQDCFGTNVITSPTTFEVAGYCTVVPTTSGGGIWAAFEGNQDGGTWTVLRGAGTFQGATGGGTYDPVGGQWPDGKAWATVKGTIETP